MMLTWILKELRRRRLGDRFRRLPPDDLDAALLRTRVPTEFPRKTRVVDPISLWKANELQALVFAYIPALWKALRDKDKGIRRLWLHLGFLSRVLLSDDADFERLLDTGRIPGIMEDWIKHYESLFGQENCVYNIHIFSHAIEFRRRHSLAAVSCFKYEDYYSHVKKQFAPGTMSQPKQILEKTYMKAVLGEHRCQRPVCYSKSGTSTKVDDSLVYINDSFYRITHREEGGNCTVHSLVVCKPRATGWDNLPWDLAGVVKLCREAKEDRQVLHESLFQGKLVLCEGHLSKIPLTVLATQ